MMLRRTFLKSLAVLAALFFPVAATAVAPNCPPGRRWRFQPGGVFVPMADGEEMRQHDLVLWEQPGGTLGIWHCTHLHGAPSFPGAWGHTALYLNCELCHRRDWEAFYVGLMEEAR